MYSGGGTYGRGGSAFAGGANSDNVLTSGGAIGTVGSAKMLMFPNAWAALFDLNGSGGGPVVTSDLRWAWWPRGRWGRCVVLG